MPQKYWGREKLQALNKETTKINNGKTNKKAYEKVFSMLSKKEKKKSIAHHIIKNFDLGFSFGSSTFINTSKHHWTYEIKTEKSRR